MEKLDNASTKLLEYQLHQILQEAMRVREPSEAQI